ncbi:MAG: FtsX-like permease family protein [Candidatus Heimdallarchaeota archaeon]|nr:FtsX-like permease family protein [Candidatus Heimdallarchaeota archaeon]
MNELDKFVGEEEEISKYKKAISSISFNIKLIWKNIINRRRSITIIILGLVFSMSILFTASIWSSTSQKIIADDYLQTLDYEMYVSTFLPNHMQPVFTYVLDDPLVEDVHWYYPTVALFNFEGKADNYTWYPEEQQDDLDDPLSISAAHIVSSAAMERIKLNLEVDGDASLNQGEIMISYVQAKQLGVIYNKTISPGDQISVAITRYIPNTDIGEHQMVYYDIDDTTFENFTISGIYKYVGKNTIIAKMLGGIGNTGGVLLDSIFFPKESLGIEDLNIMDSNGLIPKLLVKVSGQELRAAGIADMPDTIYALKERIEFRYWHAFANILSQEIQAMADEYTRSFGSTVVFLPTIAVSIILTILSSQMTVRKRKEEIAYLRSKGAVSGQIIMMFFGEFLLISTISLVLSIGIGILLSGLIPSFGHDDGFFSKEFFSRYFSYLEISPYYIEIFTVLVLGIYLGMTLYNVITFVRKDIHESQIMTKRGQKIIKTSVKVGSFVLILAGFIFLMIEYYRQVAGTSSFGFSTLSISIQALLVFIVLLFFICYFISLGINKIIMKLGKVYKTLFKRNSFMILKNLKRQRKNLTDLTFFLVLTICLLTTLVTLRSSTIYNNEIEDDYRMGADLRIESLLSVNISYMEETLGQIEGIKDITGFQTIRALWGTQIRIEVYGIDPDKFLEIGRWTDMSFVNMTAEEGLMTLDEQQAPIAVAGGVFGVFTEKTSEKGLILSNYLVRRLDLELGAEIEVAGFTGSGETQFLTITGVIESAPGLGVSHGYDPKMNRETDDWVLMNKKVLIEELDVHNGTLLLASMKEGANADQIKQEIESMFPFLTVNPEQINPDYIGYFIDKYIPPVTVILLAGAIILNVIGVIYILISTDFILEQRRRENAVLLALGGNQTKVRGLLISEVSTFLAVTLLIGGPLGIAATAFSLLFIKPLLVAEEVIPLVLHVDGLALFIILASLCLAALFGMIPIIRKQMKYEIVQELRAIV